MELVRTKLEISNPRRSDLEPIEVEALAATGALYLCIPEHVRPGRAMWRPIPPARTSRPQ